MRGIQAQDALILLVGRSGVPSEPLWLLSVVCVLLCWGSNSGTWSASVLPLSYP